MMTIRQNAKSRARRRQKSGGAVIFIVATTLALLAAIGVYALSSAASDTRSSGYYRQATQAQYMSELGGNALATYIDMSGAPPANEWGTAACQTVPAGATGDAAKCKILGSSSLAKVLGGKPLLTSQSLGGNNKQGDTRVEISGKRPGLTPWGYALSQNLSFTQVTLTSWGMSQPAGVSASDAVTMARGTVTYGPEQQ